MQKLLGWLAVTLLLVAVAYGLQTSQDDATVSSPAQHTTPAGPDRFVGSGRCVQCHEAEARGWTGSDHQLAMQPASEATVLGNFDNIALEHHGVQTTWYRRDGRFFVRTDGPEGTLVEYEVKYVFGVRPLQQYLVETEPGRLQALPVAWDTRTTKGNTGGWFHIYGDERIDHDDPLHWTKRYHNWNANCADCHTTNFRKGFDSEAQRFKSEWSELGVGCESCHGPGSNHVRWAQAYERGTAAITPRHKGFATGFPAVPKREWRFEAVSHTATPGPGPASQVIEACARCHSLRSALGEPFVPGDSYWDDYVPSVLNENYHIDGQVKEEVYVYGSFLQSKMYAAGVTCMNCHDAHSLQLKAEGNALCAQCHQPSHFDTAEHHLHTAGSPGSQCVNCHMPSKNFMQIDARRDHGFRIPDPQASMQFDVPNACDACHKAPQDHAWQERALAGRVSQSAERIRKRAATVAAGRRGAHDAEQSLLALAEDPVEPEIVRATALSLLPPITDKDGRGVLRRALVSESAMIRWQAARMLETMPPRSRVEMGAALLDDPYRAIRFETARVLTPLLTQLGGHPAHETLQRITKQRINALMNNAHLPEANVDLGLISMYQGNIEEAKAFYTRAIEQDARTLTAYLNLADAFRTAGEHEEALSLLKQTAIRFPQSAEVHYALGLAHQRTGDTAQALSSIRRAATLAPDVPAYAYAHALALNSLGNTRKALVVLRDALKRNPADRGLLFAAATISRDSHDREAALRYARRLVELDASDMQALRLLQSLTVSPQ